MKLDETTLIEIQDYINALDEKVSLKPETMEDVRKAIDKHRTELKNLRLVAVSGCRILHLTLSKMPFEVMVTGEKSTEYREPSKWILSRLQGKDYDLIKFVNGYGSDKPYFIAKYRGWEIETNPYSVDFSNGLKVTTKKGTVKIYAGEIVERGNLNGCH